MIIQDVMNFAYHAARVKAEQAGLLPVCLTNGDPVSGDFALVSNAAAQVIQMAVLHEAGMVDEARMLEARDLYAGLCASTGIGFTACAKHALSHEENVDPQLAAKRLLADPLVACARSACAGVLADHALGREQRQQRQQRLHVQPIPGIALAA